MTTHAPLVSVITGGAGFIATTLIRRLLDEGRRPVVIDNLCRGRRAHLARYGNAVGFIEANLADAAASATAFDQAAQQGRIDEVWHLAANSDIPAGVADAQVDLADTFMTTFQTLQAMRRLGIGRLHFASSSAVYGDLGTTLLTEQTGPLLPISNYGAMKLASEAQISAAGESFLERAHLFRFPNVVGVPATHGVILDFVNKLRRDPTTLPVLGNGTQQKAYLHVEDLVDAMLTIRAAADLPRLEVFNIGPVDEGVTVRWIAEQVVAEVAPQARLVFGEGNKGWVGDVPRFNYSTAKLQALGWAPRLDSAAAIRRAVAEIAEQQRGPDAIA